MAIRFKRVDTSAKLGDGQRRIEFRLTGYDYATAWVFVVDGSVEIAWDGRRTSIDSAEITARAILAAVHEARKIEQVLDS